LGNITQTNGSFNVSTVVGNLNQSANINIENSIQLLAGTGSAAGNTGGGNINLGGKINANNNATLTIFSGSPNTAAYQANITGANSTGVYYKTYNASAVNVSPVNGTQNFYYRSAPTTNVTVSNKVYDTTTNASAAISGAVDGDTLQVSGIRFNNASAGIQTVNSSALDITSTNSSWVINGYSTDGVSSSATISKANVTLGGVTANNKVYDTTTNASINSTGNATVVLGNSTLANGSLNTSTAFTNYTVSGAFANASAGSQTVNLTTALADTTNYTLSGASQTNTAATIAKANVTLNIAATANNKVYDTTTNASLTSNSSGVVQLGNATAANGSLAANTSFASSGVDSTGAFNNASAGTQIVSINNALIDTANYTLVVGRTLNTSAVIAKANVFLNVPGTVSDKTYDGTTSATVTNNSSGVAQLGNSVAANGSLAANTSFGPAGVDTTGVFASPLPGQQIVNLANTLADTANYTLAGGSTLTTTAEILSNPNAQTVVAASSSSGYILQGLSSSGSSSSSSSSSSSASSKADSSSSSAPSSASASSQGGSGSTAKEDQKGSTASTSTGTVSVTPSPGGDVPIPALPMIALAD
jgi:hypothetical protein